MEMLNIAKWFVAPNSSSTNSSVFDYIAKNTYELLIIKGIYLFDVHFTGK